MNKIKKYYKRYRVAVACALALYLSVTFDGKVVSLIRMVGINIDYYAIYSIICRILPSIAVVCIYFISRSQYYNYKTKKFFSFFKELVIIFVLFELFTFKNGPSLFENGFFIILFIFCDVVVHVWGIMWTDR